MTPTIAKVSERVTCPDCDRDFHPNGLATHRLVHADLPLLTCSECPKTFRFRTALVAHERMHEPQDARFFSYVHMTSGCWLWVGSLDTNGYGRLMVMRRQVSAYRYAYEQIVGPVPEGLELDHLCRNPRCVRPDHLEPVTHLENMRRAHAAQEERSCDRCDFSTKNLSALLVHYRWRHPTDRASSSVNQGVDE